MRRIRVRRFRTRRTVRYWRYLDLRSPSGRPLPY